MSTKLTYRPEIDGLRAIAVLGVVFYHAEFVLMGNNPISGGFLGVDIFFVISGYLISLIVLKGLRDSSFTFADFYERRIRRIMPILLLVLTATTIFAAAFFSPQMFKSYAESIISTLLFYSNILFWLQDPYWAEASGVKPLLHTWSLSIEEQFYLVMPALLIVLYRHAQRHLLTTICVLGAVSLALASWSSVAQPESAFFLLHARMWELLAGTALAILEFRRGRNSAFWAQQALPILGIIVLFSCFYLFSEQTAYPSYITAIPVAATMLIIWYGGSTDIGTKLLTLKPLVAIGLISYGFYLWHFPALIFTNMAFELDNLGRLITIVLIALLSTLSYRLIEKPFRNKTKVSTTTAYRTIFITVVLLISGALLVAKEIVSLPTFSATPKFANQSILAEFDTERLLAERHARIRSIRKFDWEGAPKSTNKVLVMGDSHAGNYLLVIDALRNKLPNVAYDHYRKVNSSINPSKKEQCRTPAEAKRFFQKSDAYNQANTIVIAENYMPKHLNTQLECLSLYVKQFKSDSKEVVIVGKQLDLFALETQPQTLEAINLLPPAHRANIGSKRALLPFLQLHIDKGVYSKAELERLQYDWMMKRYGATAKKIKKIAEELGVRFVDPLEYQCDLPNKRCYFETEDHRSLFVDNHHITVTAGEFYQTKIDLNRILGTP